MAVKNYNGPYDGSVPCGATRVRPPTEPWGIRPVRRMQPVHAPSTEAQLANRPDDDPPPGPSTALAVVAVALAALAAAAPALTLVGFFAGSVCLAAVRRHR